MSEMILSSQKDEHDFLIIELCSAKRHYLVNSYLQLFTYPAIYS